MGKKPVAKLKVQRVGIGQDQMLGLFGGQGHGKGRGKGKDKHGRDD